MYVVSRGINTMESTFNTIDQVLLAETLILVLAPVIVGFFSLVSISIFWNWGTTKWRSLLQIPNIKKGFDSLFERRLFENCVLFCTGLFSNIERIMNQEHEKQDRLTMDQVI